MPFSPNRRFWIFGLFCLTIGVIYALSRHTAPQSNSTSPYILITPTAVETVGEVKTLAESISPVTDSVKVVSTPSFTATVVTIYNEATNADAIDLKKLRSKTVTVVVHKVDFGENYWTLAKQGNIDIFTLIGANPMMPFKAAYHMTLNILSRKGVLHTVHSDDTFSKWATWTSGFGLRVDPFTGKHREHTGVDLRAKYGDPVYASAPGKVIFTGVAGGYGNLIRIAHAHGYASYYGHLSKIYVKAGQKVRRGTLIGRVGATGRVTGPHLHFEIRLNGKPLDPLQFI